MQFWIIKDGEKSGPMEDYELRDLIRKKEITAKSRVWHEGADGWVTAEEVAVLKNEFAAPEPEATIDEVTPRIPEKFEPWRRFGARWFDFTLYQLVLMLGLKAAGMTFFPSEPGDSSLFRFLLSFLPFVVIEATMLHFLGATPGKILLRLEVIDREGGRLSLGLAMTRSLRVWVLGMGMQFLPLTLLAHGFGFWFGHKKGAPLWDLIPGHQVKSKTIEPIRLLLFWSTFLIVFFTLGSLVGPEAEIFMEKFMEEMNQR